MTWPPTIPAADITDRTPQTIRHPDDHNKITDALREIVSGPRLLTLDATKDEVIDGFIDTQLDRTHNDATLYPFATIAEIVVSGLYTKPDRDVPVSATLWSTTHPAPDNPGNGTVFGWCRPTNSGGARWTQLGSMSARMLVPANEQAVWVVRLFGPTGGATGFSHSMHVSRARYTAP